MAITFPDWVYARLSGPEYAGRDLCAGIAKIGYGRMRIDLDVRRYVYFAELQGAPADESRMLQNELADAGWFVNLDMERYERRPSSAAAKDARSLTQLRWEALRLAATMPGLTADEIVRDAEKFLRFVEQRGKD